MGVRMTIVKDINRRRIVVFAIDWCVFCPEFQDGCEYSKKDDRGVSRPSHECTFPDRDDFLFDGWEKKIPEILLIQPLEGHPGWPA